MSEQEVNAAAKGVEEVRLDENGQPLSKNALKKLLKAEAAAKKKTEKAQAKVSHQLMHHFFEKVYPYTNLAIFFVHLLSLGSRRSCKGAVQKESCSRR